MAPGCGREWTREHMVKTMRKNWVAKEYKEHRENILYDQERALLPATQIVANARKEYHRMQHRMIQIDNEIKRLRELKYQTSRKIRQLYNQSHNMESVNEEERKAFVKKCPVEECPGYLSSQWKCGTCNIWACPDCHVVKGETRDTGHTCNPDILATAQLLARDTKSCPKCHIDIYKIDGCNQMWCVKCHTAFDWISLRIVTDNVHNPHYFQYIRDTNNGVVPRNPLDNPNQCGNEINARTLMPLRYFLNFTSTKELGASVNTQINKITRNIIHLREVEMPLMRVNYANRNLELRIQYLDREITENDFKIYLQRSEKKNQKKQDIFHIYEMVVNTISDLIMDIVRKVNIIQLHNDNDNYDRDKIFEKEANLLAKDWNEDTLPQIEKIITYANQCLIKIGNTYSSKPYYFDKNIMISR
jgi:hypothetical protein